MKSEGMNSGHRMVVATPREMCERLLEALKLAQSLDNQQITREQGVQLHTAMFVNSTMLADVLPQIARIARGELETLGVVVQVIDKAHVATTPELVEAFRQVGTEFGHVEANGSPPPQIH